MKKILIVAGDPSGDLIAARLVETLKKLQPSISVTGIGGNHLEKVSDRFLENIVKQHALGFAISIKKILYFRHVLNNIIKPEIDQNKPDIVIPVDFYGFNCRVAKMAKKGGIGVFYYVSPQFWASRPWRADQLRKVVDLFLCLFPFEMDFYNKKKLPARFVGHPILDSIPDIPTHATKPPKVETHIGLLPGSRPEEIKRHLPVMIKTCNILFNDNPGIRLILFTVPHVSRDLYNHILSQTNKSKIMIDMVQDENYSWRAQLDIAITASGMETLENTFLGIPMVVMYKTNWITYWIARLLIRIQYLAMPNLLAEKMIVPEFIQWRANPKLMAPILLQWLKNPAERQSVRAQLLSLRKSFGGAGASERAARVILEEVA
ncbi:lipid-A-disaccharide synthase [bacterium F11]|nr:lipid-A-disaccharide synthase [bacterium F11]